MSYSRMILAAALLAMVSWLASPAMAGGGKNGGGGAPSSGGGPSKNGGGGGGGCSGNCGVNERIICVVNGQRFEVTDIRKCYQRRKIVYRYVPYNFERHVKKIYRARRLPVCSCMSNQYGSGANYSSSYTGGGYYAGGSVAAQMQAERRGMAMTDGDVNYDQDEATGYNDMPRRKFKKFRRYAYGGYEPGYVIHYGPTISKDGGY